ncbi:FKBP-type peptidyl-prolyl cis-trans isomerase [Lysobacter sp. SG-8]|uniref:Peptidyl-prolyl cis-trans isomerase n=1 Tax=Marilutibacter penaei TaxID=2759900 RepID=A0A7W3U5J0_9GAMM|nr:FKBP-type peptidyl-prolyl cis-trans isomerase N-terminal domain-containing protein [Lysobacter penaei]MBB1089333.1 FKBP-type peptidyl-prolyl cis-trans isomerase [Lysobacter penaei]
MKLRYLAVAVTALVLGAGTAIAQDTSSEKGKLSYALGYDLGRNVIESGEAVDVATIIKGLQDGYAKQQPAVPVAELRSAVENMQQRQQAKAKSEWEALAAQNKTRSDSFIAQNKAKSGVQSLPSGVQYRVIESGNGAKPTQASTVTLQISGPYAWGERPNPPRPAQTTPEMKLSEIEMPAMREALQQMQAGAKWEVTLPPENAYGQGNPQMGIPPNMAVQFEIKLLSVK